MKLKGFSDAKYPSADCFKLMENGVTLYDIVIWKHIARQSPIVVVPAMINNKMNPMNYAYTLTEKQLLDFLEKLNVAEHEVEQLQHSVKAMRIGG